MSRKHLVPILLVLAALPILGLYSGSAKDAPPPAHAPAPMVEAGRVSAAPERIHIEAEGTLAPVVESRISAEATGSVRKVAQAFVVGGFVRRGQTLLVLDDRGPRVALARARAEAARARAVLARERALSAQAARDWATLGRPGEPGALVLRKLSVEESLAALQAAEAEVEAAQLALDRVVVRSPFDALVREKHADLGQLVHPQTVLAVLAATASAEIRVAVSESEAKWLAGPPAEVEIRARDGSPLGNAHWLRNEGSIDPRSRMGRVVLSLADPYGRLSPGRPTLPFGSFVRVRLPARLPPGSISVPRLAVHADASVLAIDALQRLRVLPVEVLRTEGQDSYLRADLAPGDRVVVSPLEAVAEGMQLRVAERGP